MNEYIYRRKSTRKFEMTELDVTILNQIKEQITKVAPLYSDIPFSIDIVSKTKGIFGIKAPYYLVFGSEKRDGYAENIGFIGQQLDLFFAEIGLGACWLGMAKPAENDVKGLPFVITIAFGKAMGSLYRDKSDFKRKNLSDISNGSDLRLEAARVAPSGMNAQGWYFVVDEGKIHCYRKKANTLTKIFSDAMSGIDLGIAICHLAEETKDFKFEKVDSVPELKGYIYTGTVL